MDERCRAGSGPEVGMLPGRHEAVLGAVAQREAPVNSVYPREEQNKFSKLYFRH